MEQAGANWNRLGAATTIYDHFGAITLIFVILVHIVYIHKNYATKKLNMLITNMLPVLFGGVAAKVQVN